MVSYQATDSSNPLSQDNPPLRGSSGLPIIACEIDPFDGPDEIDYPGGDPKLPTGNSAWPTRTYIKRALRTALLKAIVSVPYRDSDSVWHPPWGTGNAGASLWSFSNEVGDPVCSISASQSVAAMNSGLASQWSWNDPPYYPVYDRREGYNFSSGDYGQLSMAPTAGLRGAFNTLVIDMVQLDVLINNRSLWLAPGSGSKYVYDPNLRYNGVVYVELPLANQDMTRFPPSQGGSGPESGDYAADMVRTALCASSSSPGYSVLVRNAGRDWAGYLPQAPDSSIEGFTLATNGPVYIWGSFNADGYDNWNTPSAADSDWNGPSWPSGCRSRGKEIPALIAADAVTVLNFSGNNQWWNTFDRMTWSPFDTGRHTADAFTEVSAGVIAGIVPTRPWTDFMWHGGVHNMVRFLENWQPNSQYNVWDTKTTYGYRGALVSLFESEVAKAPYYDYQVFMYWFNGPNLKMGYHDFFRECRFPPGLPIMRKIRRMATSEITAAEWNSGSRPSTPPAYY
jgi:hypothetical protein